MYKCSECGFEYKVKPDYCDCGNDSFEEIITEAECNNESKEIKSVLQESLLKRNLPSILFLICCIILSFVILFFIGNPKDVPMEQKNIKEEKNINIPDIDKIWNDEKPKYIPPKKVEQPQEEAIQPKITKVELKKEPIVISKPKLEIKSKPVVIQKTQPIVKQQPKVQTTSKPRQTKPELKKQNAVQNTQVQPTQQKIQPQVVQQQVQPSNIQTTPKKTINPEELKQYKKALRNKIASNIDFLNIAGDGSCILSFNISSSGALLNRKFISQSQNTSLNDAVYSAMLKVSSFKAPPSGYKNETMKLTVKISGGNFSVSLE